MILQNRKGWCVILLCAIPLLTALAAPPSPASSQPVPAESAITSLKTEIQSLTEARAQALAALNERYRAATPAERTDLEAESATVQADYERAYLTLILEYHRLTGNTVEMERAARMLAVLDGELPARPAEQAGAETPVLNGQEGVQHETR